MSDKSTSASAELSNVPIGAWGTHPKLIPLHIPSYHLGKQDAGLSAQHAQLIRDIAERRSAALAKAAVPGASTADLRAAVEEATTQADIENVNLVRATMSEGLQLLVRTLIDVETSFGAFRCAVCGMTPAQAHAADNDCTNVC